MDTVQENSTPGFAGFDTEADAIAWRRRHGGWLFKPENLGNRFWFDLTFTPSRIFTHPAISGLSGTLL